MSKPREFWVRTKDHEYKDITRDMDRLCLVYEPSPEPMEVFIHVIEHSAYMELVEALKFYAKKKNWIAVHHELTGLNPEAPIDGENGELARKVLIKHGHLKEGV